MATRPPTVTDDELLQPFRETEEPFLTIPEIKDEFDITRQQIDSRLKDLAEEGEVCRKKAGQATIWWLPGQAPQ